MNRLRFSLVLAWSGLLPSIPLVVEAQPGADKRLMQKTSVQADAKPVKEVLRELGEKHKLAVEFDPSVAAEGGASQPFTLTADGLTLGSVIHLACESANLVYTVDKGRLLVTTREAEEKILIAREYPLGALGGIIDLQALAMGLTEVTSGSWMDVDGEGGEFMAITPRSLTIRQTRTVHAQLQSLFEQIAAATGRARIVTAQDRAEQMIVRKLQTPSPFEAGPMELPDLLDQLLKKNGVPFWVDVAALADEGIDWTKLSSTVGAKKVSPAARLDAIGAEHQLSWRFANEVVQITSAVKGDEQLFTRVYDVRGSIAPNRPMELLLEQLTSTKELGPWQITDGDGGGVLPLGTLLVIRQTSAVHTKLAKILK